MFENMFEIICQTKNGATTFSQTTLGVTTVRSIFQIVPSKERHDECHYLECHFSECLCVQCD
jgi:hypothetical protein